VLPKTSLALFFLACENIQRFWANLECGSDKSSYKVPLPCRYTAIPQVIDLKYHHAAYTITGATASHPSAKPPKGIGDSAYRAALAHIHKQTRQNGIDAALHHVFPSGEPAALQCSSCATSSASAAQGGYPIVVMPIGLDGDG